MIARAAAGVCAAAAAACWVDLAAAQPRNPAPRFERPVATTSAGPHKLKVDVPLLTAGQRFMKIETDRDAAQATGGLGDLRLYTSTGQELPYLLISAAPPRPSWRRGSLLPVAPTKTTSGFEVDLGDARLVDGLELGGLPAPFMKRFRLEGSGDRERWTVLVAQGTLFDLPQERIRQVSVDFPGGSYRYFRVTWDDTNSAVLPLPRLANARDGSVRQPDPPLRAPAAVERQASEPGRTRYRVRLPAAGLPVVALALDVSAADVFRTAVVLESRFSGARAEPAELGRTRLMRSQAAGDVAPLLRVPIDAPRGAELQLVIEDGNNPPLDVRQVFVEFALLPWIYFEAPAAGTLVARYGDPAVAPPLYDLEARRASIHLEAVPEASWGDPSPAEPRRSTAEPPVPDRGARIEVSRFRYRRALPESGAELVSLQLDAAVLAHSRGPDRGFADVRVADREGYQVPYLLERRDEPLAIDLPVRAASREQLEVLREQERGQRSVYALTLPYSGLPAPRLVLETSDRVFRRRIHVGVSRRPDRQHRSPWLETLATREWQHADQGTAAEPLHIPVQPGESTDLLLIVEEGDNRPLTITSARLLLPSWRVRFFRPEGEVSLQYGSDSAAAPQYDLTLLAPAVMGASATDAAATAEQPIEPATAARLPPAVFWAGIGVAVIVLLAVLVRLVTSGTEKPQ